MCYAESSKIDSVRYRGSKSVKSGHFAFVCAVLEEFKSE